MVRLGLLDSDDDEMPEAPSRSPYAAPTADDDTDEERDAPHAALDRTPRRSFSPGGLFSRADGSGRAEASPGARERLGLAAQLDLDADAVTRWRRALSPRQEAIEEQPRDLLVVTPPLMTETVAPVQLGGPRPVAASKTLRRLAEIRRGRGLAPKAFSNLGDAGLWLARSFRPSFSADGRLARPVVGRGAFFVELTRVRSISSDPEPALRAALAHLQTNQAPPDTLPSRALPACPDYDDDLYASAPARMAVARAVHAYGGTHDGRLREAFELVNALWLHDACDGTGDAPPVASAWARELRRNHRDDAVCGWLAARARDEVRADHGDRGFQTAFQHLARHDVASAAKACLKAGSTRAALVLAARDEPSTDAALKIEFARARAKAAASGEGDDALEARVLGAAAGVFDLEDDVERSTPRSAAGLKWRTRLGLHAWYGRGEKIEDALAAFDAAVCAGSSRSPLADEGREDGAPAAHYTLLKLAFSNDALAADASLSSFAHGLPCGAAPGARWHLALCLRALGIDVPQSSLAKLGTGFVEEMCGKGLWHWALLVIAATHDDADTRAGLAKQVLDRHAYPPDDSETPGAALRPGAAERRQRRAEAYELRRAFCGAALQTPDEWLEGALATRAGAAFGGSAAHISHLVGARRWADAEKALRRGAPEAMIAGRPAALRPVLEACEAAFLAEGEAAVWRDGAGLYLDYARFRDDLAAAMVALEGGVEPDGQALAALALTARALRARVDGAPAALAADAVLCATAGDAPDDLVLLACRSHLSRELHDAARTLSRAAADAGAPSLRPATDPVDDVPEQTPHANCKHDVCIELADALMAGE